MSEQLSKVKHDYIRYANCWEDADVLLEALKPVSGDRILSIGSAGDNSFSLLCNDPEIVVAVDVNKVQLNVIELKRAALKSLSYDEFIQFLGFSRCDDRISLYHKLRSSMASDELKNFWDHRTSEIQSGIIYAGKFERYFTLFRTRILPLVHAKRVVKELFNPKGKEEQQLFFDKKWNSWRWRLLFKLFFSRFVMGRFGRDPRFLNEVEVKVSDFILAKAARHLSSEDAQNNYFLHFIMLGDFGKNLPHYARRENYEAIRANLDRLITYHGYAEDVFRNYKNFTKFNLSNIFEYMDEPTFKQVSENIIENAQTNARIAYWNLMVPRQMTTTSELLEEQSTSDLIHKDKGFFYSCIHCDRKR